MNERTFSEHLESTDNETILDAISEWNREMGERFQHGIQRICDVLDADEAAAMEEELS